MKKNGREFALSEEDLEFFKDYTDFLFKDKIDFSQFEKELSDNPNKILIDFLVLFNYSRVSRYASKFVKSKNFNQIVTEFRKEFRTFESDFSQKLSNLDQKIHREYWYKKELMQTALYLITFSASNEQRKKQRKPSADYSINIVALNPIEEKLGSFLMSTLVTLNTFGDLIDYYSKNYVEDFEYLYGNYTEPAYNILNLKKRKFYPRHQVVQTLIEHSNSKYKPLFEFMNSSLRNALAHKSYFVIEEEQKIKYLDYRFHVHEMNLNDLEEHSFNLKILRYLLITSEDDLRPPNNSLLIIILNLYRVAIDEPKKFLEFYESISQNILEKILTQNNLGKLNIYVSGFYKQMMKYIMNLSFKWLDYGGYQGYKNFISFILQFYNLVDDNAPIQAKEFLVRKLADLYSDIDFGNKIEETKLKKYLQICLIRFIDEYDSNVYLIKLYDNILD